MITSSWLRPYMVQKLSLSLSLCVSVRERQTDTKYIAGKTAYALNPQLAVGCSITFLSITCREMAGQKARTVIYTFIYHEWLFEHQGLGISTECLNTECSK
jgi:hypothetical protein